MLVIELIEKLAKLDPNLSVLSDDWVVTGASEMFWSDDHGGTIDVDEKNPNMVGERVVQIHLFK